MPEKTKTSEEDYLDRLLNNVLNEDSGEDIFDNQELQEMSDNDFLDSIEKDLFEESFNENQQEQMNAENIAKENFEESTEQKSESEEQKESESGEDDIKGLYDILGVKEENQEESKEDGESVGDIEKLEKEKNSWRKRRKERKEQKEQKKREKEQERKDREEREEVSEENSEKKNSEEEKSQLDQAFDSMEQSVNELLGEDVIEVIEEEPPKKKKAKKTRKPKKSNFVKKSRKPKKKPKARKPKTVRKPRENSEFDEKVRISVPVLLFLFSLSVLTVLALVFGGNYRQYQQGINQATSYYVDKRYGEAYDELNTLDIKKGDEYFWGQVKTVMQVYGNYRSYEHLIEVGDYEDALDSLLTGVRMFDKYIDVGRDEYNCYDDMNQVMSWITQALNDVYGITESEAREINLTGKGEEYSYRVAELAYQAERKEMEANDSNS